MANETIKKVYAAEQAADAAENAAEERAEEIIKAARQKAENIVSKALSDAKNNYAKQISKAKEQAEALSKSNEVTVVSEVTKLDVSAKSKQELINKAALEVIL